MEAPIEGNTLNQVLQLPGHSTQMFGTIKPFFIEIDTFIEKQKYPLLAN